MKTPARFLLSSALLASALALAAHRSFASSTASDETKLGEIMGGMRGKTKALAGTIGDAAKNADSLKSLDELERLILDAKLLEPTDMPEIAADKQPAHLAAFRHQMALLLSEVAQVEAEVAAGKNADAEKRLKNKVTALRDEGHQEFQPEDEHGGGGGQGKKKK